MSFLVRGMVVPLEYLGLQKATRAFIAHVVLWVYLRLECDFL